MPLDTTSHRTEPQLTQRPIDPATPIGHVHLKVADLERALADGLLDPVGHTHVVQLGVEAPESGTDGQEAQSQPVDDTQRAEPEDVERAVGGRISSDP